jgi:hypothetical protein
VERRHCRKSGQEFNACIFWWLIADRFVLPDTTTGCKMLGSSEERCWLVLGERIKRWECCRVEEGKEESKRERI